MSWAGWRNTLPWTWTTAEPPVQTGSLVKNSRRKITVGGQEEFTIPAGTVVTTDEFFIDFNEHTVLFFGFENLPPGVQLI